MPMNVAVIGSGAMGTACAALLAERLPRVALWGRNPELMDGLRRTRENRIHLPGVSLPEHLELTAEADRALRHADCIVLAVPTRYLRETLGQLAASIPAGLPAVSVIKGIENSTFRRPSEIIVDAIGERPVAALSGPCHAEEAARHLPCSLVAASDSPAWASAVQELFTSDRFRVYTNTDLPGVELAGAIKNVMAIAAGISDGLGYGDNAKSALLTRGIVEMMRFGGAMNAASETFWGLAGIGDLITTCVSPHGRNRRLGELLARGESLQDSLPVLSGVAEGVNTCRSVVGMAAQCGVEMPITTEVYRVLFEGKSPQDATNSLMLRPLREE